MRDTAQRTALKVLAAALLIMLGGLVMLLTLRAASHPTPNHIAYEPALLFGADVLEMPRTPERSPSGSPAATYWQNRADYRIDAKLDEGSGTLAARDEITYTNNSPDTLPYVWLQLEQNLYRADSRGALSTEDAYAHPTRVTQGLQLKAVYLESAHGLQPLPYTVNDTNMRLDLPSPIPAHGGSIRLVIDYSFEISDRYYGEWTRMGRSKDGLYSVAQWYPRMVVYDDLRGWETLPYLGSGEFFLEYGDIQYNLDVPANYIVAGSGELLNPTEVLTSDERQRLAAAAASDQVVHVRTAEEAAAAAARPAGMRRLIWRFGIKNARDAAWGASSAYVWDAVRIRLPQSGQSLVMALYPASVAAKPDGWNKVAGYLKQDLEYYSAHHPPYPYPVAVAIAGPTIGMEYPACVFLSEALEGDALFSGVLHEIGHSWFPIVVGSNERRYAWMDEGFDTFMQYQAQTEFSEHHDLLLRPGRTEAMIRIMKDLTVPIMTPADRIPSAVVRSLEYEKTSYGLALLREYILDARTFDHAFNDYFRSWAYKHPSPYDFFRFFNNETGEDLSWFWREWFLENWQLDQAVTQISYPDGRPSKGALITLENRAQMAMPADVAIKTCDGHTQRLHLPVEIWSKGGSWTFHADTQTRIKSVSIDPDEFLPDIDRSNNTLTGHCL